MFHYFFLSEMISRITLFNLVFTFASTRLRMTSGRKKRRNRKRKSTKKWSVSTWTTFFRFRSETESTFLRRKKKQWKLRWENKMSIFQFSWSFHFLLVSRSFLLASLSIKHYYFISMKNGNNQITVCSNQVFKRIVFRASYQVQFCVIKLIFHNFCLYYKLNERKYKI